MWVLPLLFRVTTRAFRTSACGAAVCSGAFLQSSSERVVVFVGLGLGFITNGAH